MISISILTRLLGLTSSLSANITPIRVLGEDLYVNIDIVNKGLKSEQIYKPMIGSVWVSPIGEYARSEPGTVVEPAYSGLWFTVLKPSERRHFSAKINLSRGINLEVHGVTVFRVTYTDFPAMDALAFLFKQGTVLSGYAFDSPIYCLDIKTDGSRSIRRARATDLKTNIPGLNKDWTVQAYPRSGRTGFKLMAKRDKEFRAIRSLSDFAGIVKVESKEQALDFVRLQSEYSTYFLFDDPTYATFVYCGGKSSSVEERLDSFYIKRNTVSIKTGDIRELTEEVFRNGKYRLISDVSIGKLQSSKSYGFTARLATAWNPDLPPIQN